MPRRRTNCKSFQRVFPDWNPRIVNFRLNYLAEKIAEVTAKLPSTNAPPPTAAVPAAPGVAPVAANATAARHGCIAGADRRLAGAGQRLQGDNETLQSKLKEALAAQPAAVSPDQLAQAQQQIRLVDEGK